MSTIEPACLILCLAFMKKSWRQDVVSAIIYQWLMTVVKRRSCEDLFPKRYSFYDLRNPVMRNLADEGLASEIIYDVVKLRRLHKTGFWAPFHEAFVKLRDRKRFLKTGPGESFLIAGLRSMKIAWKRVRYGPASNVIFALRASYANDYGHPGMVGVPPQQWNPRMGGPPPQDWRHGNQIPVDNNAAAPPAFGPPPMQGMPAFQGYENIGGFNQMIPLPPPPPPPPPAEPPLMDFGNMKDMDEDACREALMQFVSENCCYGSGTAKDMNITDIQPSHAMHYTLETFTESRSTGYHSEPYKGGYIDGPDNGPPPPPWAIPCSPDVMFQDQQKFLEVPHTATMKECHACDARGYTRCHRCHGWGRVQCHTCGGDGRLVGPKTRQGNVEGMMEARPCYSCGGDGRRSCSTCGGDGRITCRQCDGYRNIKCFVQLKVNFKNNKDDHIIEKTDMPDELVRDVGGTTIFEQTLMPVWPITTFFVREVNDNSVRLVNQHKGAFADKKNLLQRQVLRGVPVTEVHYRWKETSTRYWVYGNERKVYAPDYPQQCCWGCTIL